MEVKEHILTLWKEKAGRKCKSTHPATKGTYFPYCYGKSKPKIIMKMEAGSKREQRQFKRKIVKLSSIFLFEKVPPRQPKKDVMWKES